jgi:regulatory protein
VAGRRHASFAERRAERAAIDDPEVVLAAALRFLETRSRSIAEVRRRLGQAGYREDLVQGAIARLGELGVLDDEAFARSWVESRDRARPRGEIALRRELALKGVERGLVDDVLADRGDGDDPEPDATAAHRLLERRGAALLRVADPRARRQKAYALLARNGFDPGVCASVSRAWVGDGAASVEPEVFD